MYFGPATGNACINYLKGITTNSNSSHSHPHSQQRPQDQPPKGPSSNGSTGSKTAPAVPLLNDVQSQQLADGSVVALNPAEWLVDLFTQADRDGRGGEFADAYDASQLKQVCCNRRRRVLRTVPATCGRPAVLLSARSSSMCL